VDVLDQVPVLLGVLVQRGNVVVELLPERDVHPQVVVQGVDGQAGLEQARQERLGVLGGVPATVQLVHEHDDPALVRDLL
jgi:hypothetical protein